MHKWKAIDKDGHIITGVIVPTLLDILVYDLDEVVMNIVLVYEPDVPALTGVSS